MKNSVFILFLSVCVLLQVIKLSNAEPYEYYLFVLQYPRGVCYRTPIGYCNSTLPTKFTVHGIWPANFSNIQVTCKQALKSHPFDNAQMTSSLQTNLTNSWPSVITRNNNMQFWQHEYSEHGSCTVASGVPPFTQKSYFETGQQLWQQFDIYAVLDQSNITPVSIPTKPTGPVKSYTRTEIVTAIEKKIGQNKTAVLKCKRDTHRDILIEVIICLDHQANNVITCPSIRIDNKKMCNDPFDKIFYVA